MQRKTLCTLAILALLAGLLMLGAVSAVAYPNMGSNCYGAGCHVQGQPYNVIDKKEPAQPAAPNPAPAPKPVAPAPQPTASSKLVLKNDSVTVNGKTAVVPVAIHKGLTLVQGRALAGMYGAVPLWDAKKKVMTFKAGSRTVHVFVSQGKIAVDGKEAAAATRIINNRVFVELAPLQSLLAAPVAPVGPPAAPVISKKGAEGYVGSEACLPCHQDVYDKWVTSSHANFAQRVPATGNGFPQERFYPWVKEQWDSLDTYMLVDRKDSNTIYVSTRKTQLSEVEWSHAGKNYQRYLVYYDGSPLQVWEAKTTNGGISWTLDKSKTFDYPGNKERAGYKFLFIEAYPNGKLNPNNYGEWRSWQERCIACHTSGFDYQAWDKAKQEYVKGERADLRDLFAADERIGCESCHGPGAEHLAKPVKGNIINPAKLEKQYDRFMVCAQCHTRADVSKKSNLANDLRGFRIGEHYEDYATYQRPAWGDGNRRVSIDGKGRGGHQQDMDMLLSAYLKPWGIHGQMACFDCHNAHSIGNNKENRLLKKTPEETCGTCHGASFNWKNGLDGRRGWQSASFPNWGTEWGRAANRQHLFNYDSQGRVFGLTPDQYHWVLRVGGNPSEKKDWQAIWPWEKERLDKAGRTTFVGAQPWNK